MIIFNEGNPGRTGVISGNLIDAAGNRIVPTIPVAFTAFATGNDLLNEYNQAVQGGTALPSVNIGIKAVVNPNADDYNVIADSKGGDPNHVLVVDAHLDAIYGAGAVDFFTRTVSTTFPPQVYQPSTVARDQGIQYFSSIGLNHELLTCSAGPSETSKGTFRAPTEGASTTRSGGATTSATTTPRC